MKKKWLKVWTGVIGVALAIALILTFLPVGVTITSGGMLSIELGAGRLGAQEVGELIELRTRTSKTYYLGNNQYSLDASIGSVHYQDEFGAWQEIDNRWQVAQAPWDWEMAEDGYHTRVLEDFTAGQVLKFESQGESVAFQPMALEWTNALDQISQISMPQDVAVSVSNEPVELLPGMEGSVSKIRWDDGYGTGRHFEWGNTPGRLSKLLILDSSPPAPPQYIIDGGSPVLRLNFIFDPSPALDIYIDGELWDKKSTDESFNTIEFKKEGEVFWGFMPAAYWDSSEDIEEGSGIGYTELRKVGNKLYVSVRVPYEWLQTATFPVYIDPDLDLQVGADLDDVYEVESSGTVTDGATVVIHMASTSSAQRYWGAHRWVSASLPSQGDTITVAYAELYIYSAGYDDANGNWHFEKVASPAQFTAGVGNTDVTERTRTDASASHIANAIAAGGAAFYQTPSLVTPLQEVIDAYSPTALALIFRPNQDAYKALRSYAHNQGSEYGAKLHIEWTVAEGCAEDISNTPSSWSVNSGTPVDTNSTYTTGLTFFEVTNNSGGSIDIDIKATDMTGGNTWTLSDTATPASMVYGLKAGLSGGDYTIIVKKNSPYNDLVTGLADSGTQDWGLKLYTPTIYTDGVSKSGTVTITASCV